MHKGLVVTWKNVTKSAMPGSTSAPAEKPGNTTSAAGSRGPSRVSEGGVMVKGSTATVRGAPAPPPPPPALAAAAATSPSCIAAKYSSLAILFNAMKRASLCAVMSFW